MANPNTVTAAILAKVAANTSIDNVDARPFTREYAIPSGETWLSGATSVDEYDLESDAAAAIVAMRSEFEIAHHLTSPGGAAAYLAGAAQADLIILLDPDFYSTVAGVYDVLPPVELSADPDPVGNVIVYAITVRFRIEPD